MSWKDDDRDLSIGMAKAFLTFMSLIVGVFVYENYNSIIISIIVALGYPIIGALVVSICSNYRKLTTTDTPEPWNRMTRLVLGGIWPLTLAWSIIVYTFLIIINLFFPKDKE